MTATVTPDKTLDLRGMDCPLVLAKTKQTMDGMDAGSILEVITNDSCTEFDIPAWVKRTGKELVNTIKDETEIKFFIKKL